MSINHPALAKWNWNVASGDVLLLSSHDADGEKIDSVVSKAYQSAVRKQRARFTHVAIVVHPSLIADAMPPRGVGIGPWKNVEDGYDLQNCWVARNLRIAGDPSAPERVLRRAQYYYKQPYKLLMILSPDGELKDQAGVVCSQFAALLLRDVGVVASDRPPLGTLPIDIDIATRDSVEWRQFPFLEYGLCTKAKPPADPAYRKAMNDAVPLELSEDQQRQVAEILAELPQDDPVKAVDALIAQMDTLLAKRETLQADTDAAIVGATQATFAASNAMQELDDKHLELQKLVTKALAAGQEAALPEQLRTIVTGNDACSGVALLSLWKHLFGELDREPGRFLHEVRAAENLLERQTTFEASTNTALTVARSQVAHAQRIIERASKLAEELQRSMLTLDTIPQLRTYTELVLKNGKMLEGEDIAAIDARISGYGAMMKEAGERLAASGAAPAVKGLAIDTLISISGLDLERKKWVIVQPVLLEILGMLSTFED
jgi:hypothetical protein